MMKLKKTSKVIVRFKFVMPVNMSTMPNDSKDDNNKEQPQSYIRFLVKQNSHLLKL